MSPDQPTHPVRGVPVAGGAAPAAASRHHTVLPSEPAAAVDQLQAAMAVADDEARHAALVGVAAEHPAFLEVWARLSELSLSAGHAVPAYAFARVAYHRGLDRLRRSGWGGTGLVRWLEPSNRGFLRGLHALLAAAAALGEGDEAARCREFLLELDPDDTLTIATYPQVPGPGWHPPALP